MPQLYLLPIHAILFIALIERRNADSEIYLGRRRGYSGNPANFSLRNFEADLQIFDQLGLGHETSQHARVMAFALAVSKFRSIYDPFL